MKLRVINSGSKGNAYILDAGDEALLIECGVHIKEIKHALKYDFSKVVGCILTHEHGDHAKSVKDVMGYGIDVFATEGTFANLGTLDNHRANIVRYQHPFGLGRFTIKAFDVLHDAAEPCGFLIYHPDCGNLLFITDLFFCKYTFPNLNNIIIEANYCKDIAKQKLSDKEFLRNRIIKNHMSLDTCISTLQANDLSKVNNIVLIHLSDSNSNELMFKDKVYEATCKTVTVADRGLTIDFNKTPF